MKILHLDFVAFGPFTCTRLDLREGQEGLHIIYGPNEAGKSSALRGLRQLLYGIPTRSADDFLHPYDKLRIGGSLQRSEGTVIDFIRRKGQRNTLLAPDGITLIDEAYLQTFLSGVDETTFETMFGIDHESLIKGGQEIIKGGGQVGQILFAAGAGISDFRKVQDQLQTEAEALFKPGGHKPLLNETITLFKEKKKEIHDQQILSQEWIQHDQALRKAIEDKQSLIHNLEQKQRELNRLERIKEALPIISHRKELLDELNSYAEAVLLPPDFSEGRREALTNLRLAENNQALATKNLQEIKQALEQINIPESILSQASLIARLYQETGSHLKAEKDRLSLHIRKGSLEIEAKAILQEFKKGLNLDQAEQFRLSKAQLIRIQEMGGLYERLKTKMEGSEHEISKHTTRLGQLAEELAKFEDQRETDELRRCIEGIRQQGDLEGNYKAEVGDILREEQKAILSLQKLSPRPDSLEELEKLPIPSLETIDTFEQKLGNLDKIITKLREAVSDLKQTIETLNGQIEQLRLEQKIPTEDDLAKARQSRQQGWQLIRGYLSFLIYKDGQVGTEPEPALEEEFMARFPQARHLAEAYELIVQQADELSDRLRHEADRVATMAKHLADRQIHLGRQDRLLEQLKRNQEELKTVQEEWTGLWERSGIFPRSPREMRAWVQKQAVLAEQVGHLRERKSKAEDLKARLEIIYRQLNEGLLALGESAAKPEETLSRLLGRSQQVVEAINNLRSKREHISGELKQRKDELLEAQAKVNQSRLQLEEWQIEWLEAIKPLGLEAKASPHQVNALVQIHNDLFGKLKEAEGLSRRMEDIEKDAAEFGQRAKQLIEHIAQDLIDLPVNQAINELNERLGRGQTARAKQEEFKKQIRQQEEQLRKAQKSISEIQAQLASMCEEARCQKYEELPTVEARSERLRQIQEQLSLLETQLRKLSAGATLDEFIKDAQPLDPDNLDPTITQLMEEIEQLNQQKSELDKTIGSENNELRKINGSAQTAELAQEAQGLLARLETEVEQYVQLRLACAVLNQAIESYREKNQGPIMKRSNELFAKMTLAAFVGLRVEYNDKGDPILVGVRPGGQEIVRVEGMSDGTADQLYLAIRLASLEAYLEKREAMPFIVDDILIQFDDHRAVAALQVLAQLAERTQIIFFTHHQHLVDLAKANLNQSLLFTHSLPSPALHAQ